MESSRLRNLTERYSHDLVKHCCQEVLSQKRDAILNGNAAATGEAELEKAVQTRLEDFLKPRLRRVINGTGILLHTGLGRAPLLDDVYRRAFERVKGACDLELELTSGKRGDRQDKVEDLLQFLTGAQGAAVVNNNAAAVLLALNTLAYRRETIVSRGQLIEIGGSFRLPEVMRKSGTRLVEIGTTNRTYLRDYQDALSPKTGAVLIAHTSNYRVQGFVHQAEIAEVASLCRKNKIPLIHDLGGGVIFDLKRYKLPREPSARESIAAGASVVTFSGDKILGGPQAGILVCEGEALRRIRRNPLMRALRPDKLTLALLEEILKLYLTPKKLLDHHPVLARLAESPQAAKRRAETILNLIDTGEMSDDVRLDVVPTKSQLGSGALPLEEFPSAALRLKIKDAPASQLALKLRCANPPIVGYVRRESVFIDIKAIPDDDLEITAKTIQNVLISRRMVVKKSSK